MEIIFVLVIAASLGTIVHFLTRNNAYNGLVLVPAIATASAAVLWVGLTWLGWAWDGGWIWAVSIVLPVVIAAVVGVTLGNKRAVSDREALAAVLV